MSAISEAYEKAERVQADRMREIREAAHRHAMLNSIYAMGWTIIVSILVAIAGATIIVTTFIRQAVSRLERTDQHLDQRCQPDSLGSAHVLGGHEPGRLPDRVPDGPTPGRATRLGDVGGVERTGEDLVRTVGHGAERSAGEAAR